MCHVLSNAVTHFYIEQVKKKRNGNKKLITKRRIEISHIDWLATFLYVRKMPHSFQVTYIQNSSIAVGAPWAEQIVIVWLAVWMTVALEEAARAELLATVGACEVLRMPGAAQRRDHLTDDWFVAGAAAAFLCCGNSLTIHVCL